MRKFFLIGLLFGCHPDKNKAVNIEEIHFQTTDQSEIFFKNIRKSYYDVEEVPEAGIEIYRLKKYSEIPAVIFKPIIVYNWRNDFASILLETDREAENYSIVFERADQSSHKILFEIGDYSLQTEVAMTIFNAVIEQEKIYIIIDGQKKDFFSNEEEKNSFRITAFDFLRLVEMR